MLKKFLNFLVFLIFFTTTNSVFAYFDPNDYNDYNRQNEMNSYQNNNYDQYNTFKSFQNLNNTDFNNFQPSTEGNFNIDAHTEFFNNSVNRDLVNVWRNNPSNAPDSKEYVAPNVNPSDYCGYKIANNPKTESFSNLSGNYEPTSFANAQTNANNQLTSFTMSTIGKCKTKFKISRITSRISRQV